MTGYRTKLLQVCRLRSRNYESSPRFTPVAQSGRGPETHFRHLGSLGYYYKRKVRRSNVVCFGLATIEYARMVDVLQRATQIQNRSTPTCLVVGDNWLWFLVYTHNTKKWAGHSSIAWSLLKMKQYSHDISCTRIHNGDCNISKAQANKVVGLFNFACHPAWVKEALSGD